MICESPSESVQFNLFKRTIHPRIEHPYPVHDSSEESRRTTTHGDNPQSPTLFLSANHIHTHWEEKRCMFWNIGDHRLRVLSLGGFIPGYWMEAAAEGADSLSEAGDGSPLSGAAASEDADGMDSGKQQLEFDSKDGLRKTSVHAISSDLFIGGWDSHG